MRNLTDDLIEHLYRLRDKVYATDEFDQVVSLALLDYVSVTQAGFADLRMKDEFEGTLSKMLFESSESCAMVLGIASHRLELDDGYRAGGVHIGAPILSACFASPRDVSWKQLIASVVCGYELAGILATLMQPMHRRKGFHATGTCGCMGAAVLLSFLNGYDRTQTKRALSVAAGMASGLLEMQEDGSELKPVTVGNAASSAVMAARLANAPLQYPLDAIGGPRGLLACFEGYQKESTAMDLSVREAVIFDLYKKRYPSCRHGHSALDAAQEIASHDLYDSQSIKNVQIHLYEDAIRGHDSTEISSSSQAMMSTPFCVAAMLAHGSLELRSFSQAALMNPETNRIMHLIEMNKDEELSQLAPKARGARVVVKLSNGTCFEEEVLYPKGEPENPLSCSEQADKALSLFDYAGWSWNKADEFAKVLLSPKRLTFDQLRTAVLGKA